MCDRCFDAHDDLIALLNRAARAPVVRAGDPRQGCHRRGHNSPVAVLDRDDRRTSRLAPVLPLRHSMTAFACLCGLRTAAAPNACLCGPRVLARTACLCGPRGVAYPHATLAQKGPRGVCLLPFPIDLYFRNFRHRLARALSGKFLMFYLVIDVMKCIPYTILYRSSYA